MTCGTKEEEEEEERMRRTGDSRAAGHSRLSSSLAALVFFSTYSGSTVDFELLPVVINFCLCLFSGLQRSSFSPVGVGSAENELTAGGQKTHSHGAIALYVWTLGTSPSPAAPITAVRATPHL